MWTDIPEEVEEEFNRWYNEEHIAEILAMPGFLDAARYVAVRGGPKYLACYELEGPDARETPEFLWHWDHPSEWSKRVSPRHAGINYFGNVYQQIYPAEVSQSDMSSFLLIGRMEVLPEIEDEFQPGGMIPSRSRISRRSLVALGAGATALFGAAPNTPPFTIWNTGRSCKVPSG